MAVSSEHAEQRNGKVQEGLSNLTRSHPELDLSRFRFSEMRNGQSGSTNSAFDLRAQQSRQADTVKPRLEPTTTLNAAIDLGGVRLSSDQERIFLSGPQKRLFDFKMLLSAAWDLLKGMRTLAFAGPCVTVFGSARTKESDLGYQAAREVGQELALAGFTVMTGAGPGIMEAANRGAKDVGGRSVGCNIKLPFEQAVNDYLDRHVTCQHFFTRKVLLCKYSYGFICAAGGYGTLDELFETLTLIQTGKMKNFPIVLLGKDFWQPLMDVIKGQLLDEYKTVDAADLDLIYLTDSPRDAVNYVKTHAKERFGLTEQRAIKPLRWLGER